MFHQNLNPKILIINILGYHPCFLGPYCKFKIQTRFYLLIFQACVLFAWIMIRPSKKRHGLQLTVWTLNSFNMRYILFPGIHLGNCCVLVFFYSYEYHVLNKLTYKERGDKFLKKLWCYVSGRV